MYQIQNKDNHTWHSMYKLYTQLGILLSCVLLLFTACKSVSVLGFKENQVLKVGDRYATKEQASVLMCGLQKKYETMFGTEAWSKKFGDSTLDQYIQEQVKTDLVQLASMNLMAEKKQVALTKIEHEHAKQAAKEYIERFSKKQLKYTGFEKKDVEELYVQYALASKMYQTVTDSITKEISDDQARMIDVQVIFFRAMPEEGQEFSQEERNAINERAYQVWERANAGEDFVTLASQFNEGDQLEYHIGRGEREKSFEDAAFNLASGQLSGLIEGKNGLYIIKCISNYNQAETDANKARIYEEECAKAFNKEYDKFMKDTEIKLNEKVWKQVSIVKGELPEVDFVKIFEETKENSSI